MESSANRDPLGFGDPSLDTRYFNRAMLQLPRGLIHVPCMCNYILFILCDKSFIKIIFVFPLVYENNLTTKKVNLQYIWFLEIAFVYACVCVCLSVCLSTPRLLKPSHEIKPEKPIKQVLLLFSFFI